MIRARITVAISAAVAGVVVGTACSSSEAEPQGVPTPEASTPTPSSAQPTSDPTTAAPAEHEEPSIPAAAQASGRAGAEAFVRYYIDLLNYAANTGDTTALRNVATNCGGCADYAQLYETTYEAGGWFHDPGWRPFGLLSRREGNHVTVVLQVNAPAVTYLKRHGGEPKRGQAEVYSLRFEVRRSGDQWIATRFAGQ